MIRRLRQTLWMGLLLPVAPVAPVAHAYQPPLTDVTASVQVVGSLQRVCYEVFDPVRNLTVSGCATAQPEIIDLQTVDGIVAWIERLTPSSFRAGYATYDPGRQQWRQATSTTHAGIDSLSIAHGAVAWREVHGANSIRVAYATYNPFSGSWVGSNGTLQSGVTNLVVSRGIVAWGEALGATSRRVAYAVFNPGEGSWKRSNTSNGTGLIGPSISSATVQYTLSGSEQQRGFAGGSWGPGPTQVAVFLHAAPVSGNAPLNVWFTDMSIGAAGLSWTYGDGATSGSQGSTRHLYNQVGLFNATLSATGFDGSSGSVSTAINTDLLPPVGSVSINDGDAYAASPNVLLTLSATDNSGTVTQMRLQNESMGWGAWEPYTTSRAWTLAPGDGLKTVSAQFRDASLNVSATASDTILLDTTPPVDGLLSAMPGNGIVNLEWSGFSDATSGLAEYRLFYSTNSPPSQLGDGILIYQGTATNISHTGLPNEVPHFYRLQARDNAGWWSSGSSASATPSVNVDTDGDGMPDWWELLYFGGITNAVADADEDGDGACNLCEYIAGTDPTDSNSVFRVQGLEQDAAADLILSWQAVSGRVYTVQFSETLPWSVAQEWSVAAEPPDVRWTNSLPGSATGYYRIGVSLAP